MSAAVGDEPLRGIRQIHGGLPQPDGLERHGLLFVRRRR